MTDAAADFLKYAFTETKDLAKSFLTVVTAVLVFSLTFAQNIANFSNANVFTRVTLGLAWCCFLLAIVGAGIAIYYVGLAGAAASANSDSSRYWACMRIGVKWLVAAGGVFVLGLAGLMVVALASIRRPSTAETGQAPALRLVPVRGTQRAYNTLAFPSGIASVIGKVEGSPNRHSVRASVQLKGSCINLRMALQAIACQVPLHQTWTRTTIFVTGRTDSRDWRIGVPNSLAMIGQRARLSSQLTAFQMTTCSGESNGSTVLVTTPVFQPTR